MSDELPPMPNLPIEYKTTQEPYKSNTLIRWHMDESTAIRARLVKAMEYAGHQRTCPVKYYAYQDSYPINCNCGLDAFRKQLQDEGLV